MNILTPENLGVSVAYVLGGVYGFNSTSAGPRVYPEPKLGIKSKNPPPPPPLPPPLPYCGDILIFWE